MSRHSFLIASKNSLDPKEIQLKVGLEVHQQLATKTKLFCACPPYSGEGEVAPSARQAETHEFRRILRPATSELGEMDVAAKFESRKEIKVKYIVDDKTSCLVEADEEPPHPISQEGVDTALIFSLALGSRIADEIHVMRKIVVDGSNTSGFQRTAVIALGGTLRYNGDKSSVGVQSISLEEDAARAIKEENNPKEDLDSRAYALDRLGTPLVEVALAPIEGTPEQVEDAARTLGRMLRSTGRIARGLGTIRQDLNISVMNGAVIEVKGVQRLDQINKVVLFEASRQKFFFDLAGEISSKLGPVLDISKEDVTSLFKNSLSQVLKKALSKPDTCVMAIIVRGFAGFFGKENQFHSRLGKELGAIAKTYGLGGVFHSDELPNYGITQSEISSLRSSQGLSTADGFALVAGEKFKVTRAVEALEGRIRNATTGVPAETRAASIEGETTFLRPRPGSARMYPETDIPLIEVSEKRLDDLRHLVPERWEILVENFGKKFDLPSQLAEPLFDSEYKPLFQKIVEANKGISTRYVASILVDTFQSISREGVDIYSLEHERIEQLFEALSRGMFAKEAMASILKTLALNKQLTIESALSRLGFSAMGREELRSIVFSTLNENKSLVMQKGREGARGAIMGRVMQKVRGKADGRLVSEMVDSCLAEYANEKINQ